MDPASIIGVSGVAAQLVTLLGKSIESLNNLQRRWKDADLHFLSLQTQLNTLRAALYAICQWMNLNGTDENYLLRIELDGSLQCCNVLATRIDSFLNEIESKSSVGSSSADLRRKIKLVFCGSSLDDVLKMIDRQTASMNLLLTACQWLVSPIGQYLLSNVDKDSNDTLQQKTFLQLPATQETFRVSKQDSESLYVLRGDGKSVGTTPVSIMSAVSSKLSLVFDFDRELFATKVYNTIHRKAAIAALRRDARALAARRQRQLAERSPNKLFQKDGGHALLVISGNARGDVFLKTLLAPAVASSQEATLWRRGVIRRILALDVIEILEDLLNDGLLYDHAHLHHKVLTNLRRVVDGYVELDSSENSDLSPLWKIEQTIPLITSYIHNARGLLSELFRASIPSYEPTSEDWIRHVESWTLGCLRWNNGQPLKIDITKINDETNPLLADVSLDDISMVYMVDLQGIRFNGSWMEFLVLLPNLVECNWIQRNSIVLHMRDSRSVTEQRLRGQLIEHLSESFPQNVSEAVDYMNRTFGQISACSRIGQAQHGKVNDSSQFIHIIIKYPQKTILVEYSVTEQSYLRVGVLDRDR